MYLITNQKAVVIVNLHELEFLAQSMMGNLMLFWLLYSPDSFSIHICYGNVSILTEKNYRIIFFLIFSLTSLFHFCRTPFPRVLCEF